jgi:hypothetical protein
MIVIVSMVCFLSFLTTFSYWYDSADLRLLCNISISFSYAASTLIGHHSFLQQRVKICNLVVDTSDMNESFTDIKQGHSSLAEHVCLCYS